jgi:hypothetical protein
MWLTAIPFFCIYLFGSYDYVMVHTRNEGYLLSLGRGTALIDYFTDYPLYLSAVWAVNITGGLLAPLLLLLRHRWAVETAVVSSAAMFLLTAVTFIRLDRFEIFGLWYSLFDMTILLLTAAFTGYTFKLKKKELLR